MSLIVEMKVMTLSPSYLTVVVTVFFVQEVRIERSPGVSVLSGEMASETAFASFGFL